MGHGNRVKTGLTRFRQLAEQSNSNKNPYKVNLYFMHFSMSKEATDCIQFEGLDVGGEKPHGGSQRGANNENSSGGGRRRNRTDFKGNVLFVLRQI